jgi:predicted SprT family Zn-dependent metalloprotease
MGSVAGSLGDDAALSKRARRYANDVIFGNEWPLSTTHVDLTTVTFETSTRMKRKHGVCTTRSDERCTIRLSQKTADRSGFSAIKETIRHELVHVYQHQTDDLELGHGNAFKQWVEPLELSWRCSQHYTPTEDDYQYTFHCPTCGFIGGRYRTCKTVRAAINDALYCNECTSEQIEVRNHDGIVLTDVDRV